MIREPCTIDHEFLMNSMLPNDQEWLKPIDLTVEVICSLYFLLIFRFFKIICGSVVIGGGRINFVADSAEVSVTGSRISMFPSPISVFSSPVSVFPSPDSRFPTSFSGNETMAGIGSDFTVGDERFSGWAVWTFETSAFGDKMSVDLS